MELDVDDGEEKRRGTTGKRRRERAEQREKKIEEGSERRESQNKNSETASENLMEDRSRKWEDGRWLEREGNEILELLVGHEKKEAKRIGRKQDGRTDKG